MVRFLIQEIMGDIYIDIKYISSCMEIDTVFFKHHTYHMKRILFIFSLLFLWISLGAQTSAPPFSVPSFPEEETHFIIANDLGRNGYYQQKPIAALMGAVAEQNDIEFIAAAGDVHHFMGVASTSDPLWMTNYELIYDHPELMIDWFAILGNHEYRGNTQAVLDYTQVSRRWNAPSRYYTHTFQVDDTSDCLLVFIDTTPLISKYRKDPAGYPDAVQQDDYQQLEWIHSVLANATQTWKVVIGHHPVYAETRKSADERTDLQNRLAPVLEQNGVDLYVCGHIHNFQHIRPENSRVEYVVNSAASLSRPVQPIEGTLFCSPDPGFTVCSVTSGTFTFSLVNHTGEVIYRYSLSK